MLGLLVGAPVAWPDVCPRTTGHVDYLSDNCEYRFLAIRPTEPYGPTLFPSSFYEHVEGADVALGRLERADGQRGYVTIWEAPILNREGPQEVLVTGDGRFVVTIDEECRGGHGPNVVVIYGATGNVVRAFGLNDMLWANEQGGITHTESALWWQAGPAVLAADEQSVRLLAKPPWGSGRGPIPIRIRLADGRIDHGPLSIGPSAAEP